VVFEVIIIVISKLLVITDGRRFCNSKETDNSNKYIIHVGSNFSLGSTVQPKLFVISRIFVEFLVYAIIRLIRISADFFQSAVGLFFKLQTGGISLWQRRKERIKTKQNKFLFCALLLILLYHVL